MEAQRLLELARTARWAFPSSFGNPGAEAELPERDAFAAAAESLEPGDATELAASAWRLWMVARDLDGGRAFLASVLDRGGGRPRERALALYGDSVLALRQGDVAGSRERSDAALAAARDSGDDEALALAHLAVARVAFEDADYERARSLAIESRGHAREAGESLGQAPLHMHAQSARMLGEHDEAAGLFEESLALNRRLGDRGMVGVELHNLGHVELNRGNVDAAERYFAECAGFGAPGDAYGEAIDHYNRAAIAFARGDRDGARVLLDQAESRFVELGAEPSSDDRAELDRLRRALG